MKHVTVGSILMNFAKEASIEIAQAAVQSTKTGMIATACAGVKTLETTSVVSHKLSVAAMNGSDKMCLWLAKRLEAQVERVAKNYPTNQLR